MATSHTKIEGGMFLVADMDFHGVFTPEDYTSQQKDIARAAEEFITGEIMSRGDDIEVLDNQLSRDLMRKSGELGFLGLDIPEKYEGAELDKISSALVAEKYGYGAGSFAVTELNHTGIGTFPLALFGTEDQLKRYLPGLSSGTLIGAFALTEPEAGSDALNSLTTATLSDDGKYYLLNGNKQFITNAGFADSLPPLSWSRTGTAYQWTKKKRRWECTAPQPGPTISITSGCPWRTFSVRWAKATSWPSMH